MTAGTTPDPFAAPQSQPPRASTQAQTILIPRVSEAIRAEPHATSPEAAPDQAQTVLMPRLSSESTQTAPRPNGPGHAKAAGMTPGMAAGMLPGAVLGAGTGHAAHAGPEQAQTILMSRISVLAEPPVTPARGDFSWKTEPTPDSDEEPWRPELFTRTVKTTGAVLPSPPSRRKEKYLYNTRRMWVLLLGMLISAPLLLYTQLGFLSNSIRLWVLFPIVMMTPFVNLVRLVLEVGTRDFDFDAHNKLVNEWAPAAYPSVDIMLPTCGEALEVLRNTWKYVAPLQESYPGIATVYVLDDGGRPEVRTMAAEFGFRYLARPNPGWYKKAGNLNYGLEHSKGDYILILDADFVPGRDMLTETLPHFEADPRLGILQTPQFFRNTPQNTFVERGSATSQEVFYRAIQVTRDQRDAVVCCGTNAIYRRAALAENGGITLISHSEDAHTGIDLRRLGWRVRYIPVNLASGLCPADVDSFVRQQYRWCVGTISIVSDKAFWRTKATLTSRLYDVVGFLYYVETAMYAILGPLITVILCLGLPRDVILKNFLLVLPSAIYTFLVVPLWHRVRSGADVWAVTVLVSWAALFAFWDSIRGRQMSWRPSGTSSKRRNDNRRLWLGLWTWSLGGAALGVYLSAWRMVTTDTAAFTPIFLTSVFYLVTMAKIVLSRWTEPTDA
jgi:cellulose synthase (UDP-forming)